VNYRKLGCTGMEVSEIGLGCNNFGMRIDLEGTRAVVAKALDLGVNFFDTADNYGNFGGSETLLGQVLGEDRKRIVLATKFAAPMAADVTRKNASRRYMMSAVEASLTRLKTDWIDLYQMHYYDALTPIEETLRALDDLVRQGKVRYIGCSNLAAWQMVDALWISKHLNLNRFVSVQAEYSVIVREIEREMLPAINANGMGLLPYFPLASGLLTGKYSRNTLPPADTRFAAWQRLGDRYTTGVNWDAVEHVQAFCAARGKTTLELAFNWLLSKSAVSSVIAGATKPEQLEQNVKAVGWKLTAEDLAEIDRMPKGYATPLS
jgi:aryl-alcohol dehydrogenase-like predicted oxidoreductase